MMHALYLPLDKIKILKCIEWLKKNTWHIFYFGQLNFPCIGYPVNSFINRVFHPALAHAYVLNKNAMKFIIDNFNPYLSIDIQYRKFSLKKYSIYPCINFQNTPHSYSYNHIDKIIKFNSVIKITEYLTKWSFVLVLLIIIIIIYLIKKEN